MAVTTTTVTPTIVPFPFAGLSTPERDLTPVPRRELRLYANQSIPAPGVGNNQYVSLQAKLPRNNAYSMVDCFFRLISANGGTNNWGAAASCTLNDDDNAPSLSIPLELYNQGLSVSGSSIQEVRSYTLQRFPQIVLVPPTSDAQVTLFIQIYNATANDAAYTCVFFGRVLEYSIEQAHHYEVNTPFPIR